MTNDERDKIIAETHETVIRMDQALIQAKVPERVSSLERSMARSGVWLKLIAAGATAAVVKAFTGNGK